MKIKIKIKKTIAWYILQAYYVVNKQIPPNFWHCICGLVFERDCNVGYDGASTVFDIHLPSDH